MIPLTHFPLCLWRWMAPQEAWHSRGVVTGLVSAGAWITLLTPVWKDRRGSDRLWAAFSGPLTGPALFLELSNLWAFVQVQEDTGTSLCPPSHTDTFRLSHFIHSLECCLELRQSEARGIGHGLYIEAPITACSHQGCPALLCCAVCTDELRRRFLLWSMSVKHSNYFSWKGERQWVRSTCSLTNITVCAPWSQQ